MAGHRYDAKVGCTPIAYSYPCCALVGAGCRAHIRGIRTWCSPLTRPLHPRHHCHPPTTTLHDSLQDDRVFCDREGGLARPVQHDVAQQSLCRHVMAEGQLHQCSLYLIRLNCCLSTSLALHAAACLLTDLLDTHLYAQNHALSTYSLCASLPC